MSVHFRVRDRILIVGCYSQLNLLAHAQLEELDIGSLCGGHGICGGDKIRIRNGLEHLTPLTEIEKQHLSPKEIAEGWRLGCQAWPLENHLDIQVETI